jgi:hypothetical protein
MTGLHKNEPAPADLILSNVIEAGKNIAGAYVAFAADPTVETAIQLIEKLRSAEHAVHRLKVRLTGSDVQGHGKG